MNAVWVTPQEIEQCHASDGRHIIIRDAVRLEHLHQILKSQAGDRLRTCLVNCALTDSFIEAISDKEVLLRLDEHVSSYRHVAGANKVVFVGLSRPQTIKKVLEYGTTMGVRNFYFVPATLSEKSYATAKIWELEQYTHHLYLGLAQSNHFVDLPTVEVLQSWKQIPARLEGIEQRYLCSWQSSVNNHYPDEPMAIAIGPERGWTKSEEEQWRAMGHLDLSLGASVLRVECALVSALTKLN